MVNHFRREKEQQHTDEDTVDNQKDNASEDWTVEPGIYELIRNMKLESYAKQGTPRIRLAPRTSHSHDDQKIAMWLEEYEDCIEEININQALWYVRSEEMVPQIYDKLSRHRPSLTLDYAKEI